MTPFWSSQLALALVLNAVVQAIQIGAYAARLAGVKSGRIATSISLFNLFVTASRLANLVYAPMLGTITDRAARSVRVPALAGAALHQLDLQIRLIVLAGTFGTALGALLLPVFLYLFLRGIAAFERLGSVPRAILRLVDPRVMLGILRSVRIPPPATFAQFRIRDVPANLLISNVVVTGIYAIGVVAATYASVIDPADARTAVLLSGIINGIATIAFTLIVDPTSAYITDQAVKGERTLGEVKSLVFYLALTAIVGTLLSQLILYPAAVVIAFVAHLVNQLR
ncbi:MAG: lipid II flippase family protein [Vulcanimicrobiaceae bacterium]